MDRVLVVDDDPDFCRFVEATLRGCGFETISKSSAEAGLEALTKDQYAVVLADVHLGGASGIELCAQIADRWEHIPVVVMTARGTLDTAIAAIRAGAWDFVTKPPAPKTLELVLARALKHQQMSSDPPPCAMEFEQIVGSSPSMKRVFALVERAAGSDASVLVTGESGTGKELVARALHRGSTRRAGPFIAVSCAAVPAPLLESELFGHAKGAFTDARTTRTGLLAQASGGTLFLDEIGDMPLALQPKLLRALQERIFRPVGSNDELAFDVRVVAATNVDLESAVRERSFREDLYFRINVVRIHVPPLRDRGSDVLLLAKHFLGQTKSRRVRDLSAAVVEKLAAHPWPGNVRELSNCMEHALTMSQHEEITVEDLPEGVRDAVPSSSAPVVHAPLGPDELLSLEEMERIYILKVLNTVGGNKTLAAKILGLDRKTLYRRLERYQS